MVFAVASKLNIDGRDLQQLRENLIEQLKNNQRFEDAGDLIDSKLDSENALDCYLKANAFQKAIKICLLQNNME